MGATPKTADLSTVKDRGNFNPKRVSEGDYAAIITKVEDHDKDGSFSYLFTIKPRKYSQYTYPYYCGLTENQLWKIRNLMIAAGINVPKKRVKLDPNKIVGREVGITLADDDFEGKLKSVVDAVFPVSELNGEVVADEPEDDAEDDFEEPAPVSTKKAKGKAKKGKKGKKGKSKSEDVEELDITDL